MFGEIVSQIGCPWFPKYVLVDLADSICTKLNCISIALVLFFWIVSFSIPSMVELSVCMGIACCVWHIYSSVAMVGSHDLEL